MGFLSHLLYPWGLLLQIFAIIHFIRRRPDLYWIFIILFLGPLGAAIYILIEVIPDAGLLSQSFKVFPRRKRIQELEAMVRDNPSSGNYGSSVISTWTMAGFSRRESRSTSPLLSTLIRLIHFTGVAFVR
jgi:hypothetical protein